jgi:two-component system, cell cycle sensor histidine kinase PleC
VSAMLVASAASGTHSSLMGEYATLLADAVLRQRAREAEHTARVESELASRVKSEFIANMSHELRTPLNTVIGFSKLISECGRRQLTSDQIAEYADLIRDAATHLLTVINDILDISKMQSGKYTLDAREIDLNDIVQSAVAGFTRNAADLGVSIESRIDATVPTVRGDPAKLRQVFNNLISNAVKFTPPGGSVQVSAEVLTDGGVAVIIRDTGVGMTKAEIAVALTPFSQVDASHSRWREGAGLGLPIAKALVQLHGGKLEIRSAKSLGTEVAVILPSRFEVSVAQGRDIVLGSGGT